MGNLPWNWLIKIASWAIPFYEYNAKCQLKPKKNEKKRVRKREKPDGFQVKASLYLWPSISMSRRIGTRLSAVGLSQKRPSNWKRIELSRKKEVTWKSEKFEERKLGLHSEFDRGSECCCELGLHTFKFQFRLLKLFFSCSWRSMPQCRVHTGSYKQKRQL